jgi:hypothetical protein
MKKSHLAALEKLFVYEINRALDKTHAGFPMQSKAKVYQELEVEHCVERVTVKHKDRFGEITIEGWELTHAGRWAYCETCDDEGVLA